MMRRNRIVGMTALLFLLGRMMLPGQSDEEAPRKEDTTALRENRTVIDEQYDLAIDEKRIDLGELQASLALELHAGELDINVGVGITAEDVEIVLRKVYGNVRFHATLEPLLQRVRGLRARVESAR